MRMRTKISRGCMYLVLASAMGAGCSRTADVEELRSMLVGDYRLVANSTTVDSQFESSVLTLGADGRSRVECKYKDGRRTNVEGTWKVTSTRQVDFSAFRDCSGVRRSPEGYDGSFLLIEMSNPPVLVLHPDIVGVFYEKVR